MGGEKEQDLPIALRRTPRRRNSTSAAAPSERPETQRAPSALAAARTPSKPKSKKRVRFSDPGPELEHHDDDEDGPSTGLTPMVRRTSLGPAHKRRRRTTPRRYSAPSTTTGTNGQGGENEDDDDDDDDVDELAGPSTPSSSSRGRRRASDTTTTSTRTTTTEVRIVPLRQVLDDRVKRRIRRNGLSEEMNEIGASRRRAARARQDEAERLRGELARRDAEVARLRLRDDGEARQQEEDASRVAELEAQVEALRRELQSRSASASASSASASASASACALALSSSSPAAADATAMDIDQTTTGGSYDWSLAARDPFSDPYSDLDFDMDGDGDGDGDAHMNHNNDYNDDDGFGDSTVAELVCSTPTKTRTGTRTRTPTRAATVAAPPPDVGSSFPSPPCTSPPAPPATPCSARRRGAPPATPRSHHAGTQVALADPEREALLEAELASLRLELAKLSEALESHAAARARLAEKLAGASSSSSSSSLSPSSHHAKTSPPPLPPTSTGMTMANGEGSSSPAADLEARLDGVLQALSDRTAALLSLNAGLGALGFPGRDAGEMVAALSSGLRAARLELEYLAPGESALPLSSRGAETLDAVLDALRGLSRRQRESEAQIDEYHALELSLRQQLGARVDAMDDVRRGAERDRAALRERDERVAELEVGVERLKGAADAYRRDVGELEALVQRLESEGQAATAQLGSAQSAHAAAAAELEARLESGRAAAEALRGQLADLRRRREVETRTLHRLHGRALALRDARVAELRREVDGVNASLRAAHETILGLRVEKGALERRAGDERRRAREALDGLRAELARAVRAGGDLAAANTPRKGAATRRRKSARLSGAGPHEDEHEEAAPSGEAGADELAARGAAGLAGPAEKKKTLKRRRYDSGLGFMDEDEDEVDEEEDEVELVA
ncbi:hypothetical protein GGR56DRAFT_695041 [Xylariaceae sp. FL0804]|nr:hypothetical protein GGR56DRAFT_695041 [Xylariaceae sp. FL0804]